MRASTRNDLRAPSGFSFKLQHPHLQPIPRTQPTTHERINFRAQCLTLRLGRLASKTNNHYIPRGVLTKAARRRFGPDLWCVSPLFCSSVIRSLAHSASLSASSLILCTVLRGIGRIVWCVSLFLVFGSLAHSIDLIAELFLLQHTHAGVRKPRG